MTLDLGALDKFLAIGFHQFLRIEIVAANAEEKNLLLRLPYRAEYARLPEQRDYHGGVLSSLIDVAGTFVCALAAGRPTPTMNLRTDFLKSPIRCDLIASARVVRAGRTAMVADIELSDDNRTLYAVGRGTWSVPPNT